MNTVDLARRKEAMHALNPFAPGAGRQPKELVGREQELEIMDRIIARTKAGYSDRGLVYSGLRGVGKTVLLLRMKDMAAAKDSLPSAWKPRETRPTTTNSSSTASPKRYCAREEERSDRKCSTPSNTSTRFLSNSG